MAIDSIFYLLSHLLFYSLRSGSMNKSLYDKLSKVCKKESPADLIFRDAHIFDAYTASFYDGDVAVKQGYIAGIGKDFPGDTVIDCKGKYLFPGFIDAHAHLEAALVPPQALS